MNLQPKEIQTNSNKVIKEPENRIQSEPTEPTARLPAVDVVSHPPPPPKPTDEEIGRINPDVLT